MKKVQVLLAICFLISSGVVVSSQSENPHRVMNSQHEHEQHLQELIDLIKDLRAVHGTEIVKITFIYRENVNATRLNRIGSNILNPSKNVPSE